MRPHEGVLFRFFTQTVDAYEEKMNTLLPSATREVKYAQKKPRLLTELRRRQVEFLRSAAATSVTRHARRGTAYLARIGVVHRVHVNDFVHGAGQNYVGLLFPVLQVLLRATCCAALPQNHEQTREEQRCPAGRECAPGTHDHRTDAAKRKVNFLKF